jgi:GAF domain-containing protein
VSPWLRERVKSLAGVPLRIEGRLIGVVHVCAAEPGRFAEADLELLRLVAARAAMAVERARLAPSYLTHRSLPLPSTRDRAMR